ncbi:MAG: nucleotidyltransferase family protein [Candidatus Altiarchaeota archaeon]
MNTISELKEKLLQQKDELRKKYNVKYIGIFGSFVRGEQKKTSDIDILVEFSEPIDLFEFIKFEEELSKLLGVKVDLVSKKALKPYIGERILKEVIAV